MSSLFQIPVAEGVVSSEQPFARYGLAGNPFPSSGVDTGVLYADHMGTELARVNTWINAVDAATDTPLGQSVPALALFGSLGVGKSHLLSYLERGLSANRRTPALRKNLSDEGTSRLMLADLILRHLPATDEDEVPGGGLLRKIVIFAGEEGGHDQALLASLRTGSPLTVPLRTVLRHPEDDAIFRSMVRWLRRESTSPAQRAKLGVAGVLRNEGEAIRAVADLLRLARVANVLQVWFVLIDQLEELWRPHVITPVRRARFLTDLRQLIDEAHQGAPVALVLSWNTSVTEDLFQSSVDKTAAHIQADYRALWQRLGDPVELPALTEADIWPFAQRYLAQKRAVGLHPDVWRGFERALQDQRGRVIQELRLDRAEGQVTFPPRQVLQAWQRAAERVAEDEVSTSDEVSSSTGAGAERGAPRGGA